MTYEARTNGGPWRRISPMRGQSIDEVFRQLGPGAEVRQAQEAAGEAGGVPDVASLAKRVERGARLLDGMADRILSAAQRELRQAERYEALEARVAQLEAVREMGAPDVGVSMKNLAKRIADSEEGLKRAFARIQILLQDSNAWRVITQRLDGRVALVESALNVDAPQALDHNPNISTPCMHPIENHVFDTSGRRCSKCGERVR